MVHKLKLNFVVRYYYAMSWGRQEVTFAKERNDSEDEFSDKKVRKRGV